MIDSKYNIEDKPVKGNNRDKHRHIQLYDGIREKERERNELI